jgi:hypothetical protein
LAKRPTSPKLESGIQQVSKSDQKSWFDFWEAFLEEQLSLVDFFRGDWASALFHAQASRQLEAESSFRGIGVGTLFRQMAYAGDRSSALTILQEKREWLVAAS